MVALVNIRLGRIHRTEIGILRKQHTRRELDLD